MNERGQITIEFMVVFILLLGIFLTVLSITNEELDSINQTQKRKQARMVSDDIASVINQVYIQGSGYSKTYTLPSKINQETYVVQINKTGVYINSHYQMTKSHYIPKKNIIQKDYILLPNNTYVFKNNNNIIEVVS